MKPLLAQPSLSRDFAFLAAVILFVLLLVSMWVAYETYNSDSQTTIKQLESESQRIDRTLIIETDNAAYLLQSIGRQITHYGAENIQIISQIFKAFDQNTGVYRMFFWIDEAQHIVVASGKGILDKPIDVSDRDYMKKSLTDPWKVQIGRPVEGRVSDKWIVPVAMGITDYSGKFVGTLLVSMDIDTLTQELNHLITTPGMNFAVLSKSLIPLSQVSEDDAFFNKNFSVKTLAGIDFNKQPRGIISRGNPFSDDTFYSYYALSSKYPYIILVSYNGALGEAAVRSQLLPRLVQILVVAVFMLATLWIIRARVIRPVIELCNTAADIARGKHFQAPPKGGPVEIEGLAEQIRKIDEYLKERLRVEDELLAKTVTLKRAKDKSDINNLCKGQFIQSLAAELKEPLRAITSNASAIHEQRHGQLDNRKYRDHAKDVHLHAQQLEQIIEDVLSLRGKDDKFIEVHEQPLDLGETIAKALRAYTTQFPTQKNTVQTVIPDFAPKLLADESLVLLTIRHILIYLTLKAEPGDRITLQIREESNDEKKRRLAFLFRTDGPPPQEDDFDNFDEPAQPEQRQKQLLTSGGFSLPVLRALLTLHQATLSEDSSMTLGTTITVNFPAERLV